MVWKGVRYNWREYEWKREGMKENKNEWYLYLRSKKKWKGVKEVRQSGKKWTYTIYHEKRGLIV